LKENTDWVVDEKRFSGNSDEHCTTQQYLVCRCPASQGAKRELQRDLMRNHTVLNVLLQPPPWLLHLKKKQLQLKRRILE
jgi:hypothetical protein